jgi:ABC-type dipeptide/oligopeptide/nickel transport system permease subunit
LGLFPGDAAVLAALLAPWPAPFDPGIGDLRNAYLPEPGGRYLLGTDTQGRDGHESVKGEA